MATMMMKTMSSKTRKRNTGSRRSSESQTKTNSQYALAVDSAIQNRDRLARQQAIEFHQKVARIDRGGGARAGAPAVEDEPIAMILMGALAATRLTVRSSG